MTFPAPACLVAQREPGPAALKRALLEDERAQLPRLLALIREAQAAAPDAAHMLREKLLARL